MQLSYVSRLICLAVCGASLFQVLLECAAWQIAPIFFRQTLGTSARQGERTLFLLALFARLGPWLVVLGAWIPAYVHGEDNISGERVGLLCLIVATGVVAWSLFCWSRTLHGWILAQRCCGLCRAAGRTPDGLPLLLYPGERPLLAVVGLFRSRIVMSRSLLTSTKFSAESLAIALRHEGSHARHRDNLKLLVLSLLPHIPLATRKHASLQQQWRLAAEMAADDDGSMDQPERSVLLAEMLVAMARMSKDPVPQGSFGLLSRPEDLSARICRLLQRPAQTCSGWSSTTNPLQMLSASCVVMAVLAMLCYLCTHFGHRGAELLLHIG